MKIETQDQLEAARKKGRKLVTKRALTAGVASAVPFAVTGIAADISILLELLPKINKMFGLDAEQIDELDEQTRQQIYLLAGSAGSAVIGRAITKELVVTVLKAMGVRATAKTATSLVPVVGSAISGTLGFGMMKFVGNQHVQECYDVAKAVLESRRR